MLAQSPHQGTFCFLIDLVHKVPTIFDFGVFFHSIIAHEQKQSLLVSQGCNHKTQSLTYPLNAYFM